MQPGVRPLLHLRRAVPVARRGAGHRRLPAYSRPNPRGQPRSDDHPVGRRAAAARRSRPARGARGARWGDGRRGHERNAAGRRPDREAEGRRRTGSRGERRFAAARLPRQLPARPGLARRDPGCARASRRAPARLHHPDDRHQGKPRGARAPGRMVGRARRRVVQLLLPGVHGPGRVAQRSRPVRLRGRAGRSGPLATGVSRPHAGAREVRAALHAPRAPGRPRVPDPQLRDPLSLRHAVLPHHPGRKAHAVPLHAGDRR